MTSIKELWHRVPDKWRLILGIFVISKLLIVIIAVVGTTALYPSAAKLEGVAGPSAFPSTPYVINVKNMWTQWDGHIYAQLAHTSYLQPLSNSDRKIVEYSKLPQSKGTQSLGPSLLRFSFAPLYPILGKILGKVLFGHYGFALLAITNVAFIGSLYFIYELATLIFAKESLARNAVIYLVLLPTSFLLQMGYSEALFLLCSLGAFVFATKKHWWWAGIFGALLALTRSSGFLIVIPLFILLLRQNKYQFNKSSLMTYAKTIMPLSLPLIGWACFLLYCRIMTGDFFAYTHLQYSGWGVSLSSPWDAIYEAFSGNWSIYSMKMCVVLALIAFTIYGVRVIPIEYTVFSLIMLLLSISTGIDWTVNCLRYTATVFPPALILAALANKYITLDQYARTCLSGFQSLWLVLWSAGWLAVII